MPSLAELEVRNGLIRCAVDKRTQFSSDSGIERIAVDLRSCTQVIEETRHIEEYRYCVTKTVVGREDSNVSWPETGAQLLPRTADVSPYQLCPYQAIVSLTHPWHVSALRLWFGTLILLYGLLDN